MILGVFLLMIPVLIALLVWWLGHWSTGKYGKSLAVFLLGYAIAFLVSGVTGFVHDWGRSSPEPGECILLVLAATIGGYFLGIISWAALAGLKKPLLGGLSYMLNVEEAREEAARPQPETQGNDLRQRAIEECAEEAYEYLIENESVGGADHDRAERSAARLRDAILSLGQKG